MVSTFSSHVESSSNFRDLLKLNYQNKSVVHLTAGSVVPLLKQSVWVVVRGQVKLGAEHVSWSVRRSVLERSAYSDPCPDLSGALAGG